jgi:hypothetical protein
MQEHDLLYTLQNNRDVKAVKSNNTALLEEILVERRRIVPRNRSRMV